MYDLGDSENSLSEPIYDEVPSDIGLPVSATVFIPKKRTKRKSNVDENTTPVKKQKNTQKSFKRKDEVDEEDKDGAAYLGLINNYRDRFGIQYVSRDKEGLYNCFFANCKKRLKANFSRHLSIHERNGDKPICKELELPKGCRQCNDKNNKLWFGAELLTENDFYQNNGKCKRCCIRRTTNKRNEKLQKQNSSLESSIEQEVKKEEALIIKSKEPILPVDVIQLNWDDYENSIKNDLNNEVYTPPHISAKINVSKDNIMSDGDKLHALEELQKLRRHKGVLKYFEGPMNCNNFKKNRTKCQLIDLNLLEESIEYKDIKTFYDDLCNMFLNAIAYSKDKEMVKVAESMIPEVTRDRKAYFSTCKSTVQLV